MGDRALVCGPTRQVVRLRPVGGRCDEALPIEALNHGGPVFIGEGALDYVCAKCLRVLCEGIAPGDLAGILVRCGCGAVGCVPA
jgi:hypothetical protein